MNDPRELLPLDTKRTTTQQLQLLLADNIPPLENLEVEGEAVNFELLTAIIKKNCHSLKKLAITGNNSRISGAYAVGFPSALEMCTELTFLALRNFSHYLADDYPNLLKIIMRLAKLKTLDISGCTLASWVNALDDFANNTTITKFCVDKTFDEDQWTKFYVALGKNRTLQKLDLGKSAITLGVVKLLMRVMTVSTCTITNLDLQVTDFDANETNRFIAYINNADRWAWRDYQERLNSHQRDLEQYRTTGKHPNLKSFQQGQDLLPELQNFLAEKRNRRSKTELVIEIADEGRVVWERITGQILLHARTLQHLTIKFLNLETGFPCLGEKDAKAFLDALQQCKQLRTFNMLNFMGILFTLSEEHFVTLFKILKSLPITKLSFNRTYIGPTGIDHLKAMLALGKVTNIDLTLAGIVAKSSVEVLAQGISSCNSLEKVTLGRSPLTLAWWQMLNTAVNGHRNRPALEWKFTPESEMGTKMEILTACMPYYMARDLVACEDGYKYVILNRFLREVSGIDQDWEKLEVATQTLETSSAQTPFWSKDDKKVTVVMEMRVLPAQPNTPLLPKQAQSKGYGAT